MHDDARARRARRGGLIAGGALFIGIAAVNCGGDGPATAPPPDSTPSLRARALAAGLRPLPLAPARPTENEYQPDRVKLGHLLFFDPIISGPRDVACSTCHLPGRAFTDGRQFPSGAGASGLGPDRTEPAPSPLRLMPRNSPTVFNVGLFGRMGTEPSVNGTMFWGANAFGIEDQVLNPMAADNELRGLAYDKVVALDSVVARLRANAEYVSLFAAAFADGGTSEPADPQHLVTTLRLRRALAAYLRELVTPHAPIDDYLAGNDAALTSAQQQGLALFVGKANCVACHTGPLFSDFTPHVIGVAQMGLGRDTTPGDDLGWGEHGGTPYSFRTPPLRYVTRTAPYFHDGAAATLMDVLRFKNAGRSAEARIAQSMLDPAVHPLSRSDAELSLIADFLASLDDTITTAGPLFHAPARVPSGLTIPR
jgi:cytochrome c peroxidase